VIQVTPQMRVLVAVAPVDFRKGMDGLARVAREALASDPFSGCVFVFGNRRRGGVHFAQAPPRACVAAAGRLPGNPGSEAGGQPCWRVRRRTSPRI